MSKFNVGDVVWVLQSESCNNLETGIEGAEVIPVSVMYAVIKAIKTHCSSETLLIVENRAGHLFEVFDYDSVFATAEEAVEALLHSSKRVDAGSPY